MMGSRIVIKRYNLSKDQHTIDQDFEGACHNNHPTMENTLFRDELENEITNAKSISFDEFKGNCGGDDPDVQILFIKNVNKTCVQSSMSSIKDGMICVKNSIVNETPPGIVPNLYTPDKCKPKITISNEARNNFKSYCTKCQMILQGFQSENMSNNCPNCGIVMLIACTKCNIHFRVYHKVLKHIENGCFKGAMHRCNICNYATDKANSLQRHIISKHSVCDSEAFKCTPCGKMFKSIESVKRHQKICYKSPIGKPKLIATDFEFEKLNDIANDYPTVSDIFSKNTSQKKLNHDHSLDVSGPLVILEPGNTSEKINSPVIAQKESNSNFSSNPKLEATQENVLETGPVFRNATVKEDIEDEKPNIMFINVNEFKTASDATCTAEEPRTRHLYEIICLGCGVRSDSRDLRKRCSLCDRRNVYRCLEPNCRAELRSMTELHLHGDLEHAYLNRCKRCRKSFGNYANARQHEKTCCKDDRQNCQFCSYKTKFAHFLVNHERKHHGERIGDSHACHRCNKAFISPRGLKYHRKRFCVQKKGRRQSKEREPRQSCERGYSDHHEASAPAPDVQLHPIATLGKEMQKETKALK